MIKAAAHSRNDSTHQKTRSINKYSALKINPKSSKNNSDSFNLNDLIIKRGESPLKKDKKYLDKLP